MNTNTTHNLAFAALALISILAFIGCSQKPSEEVAPQTTAALPEEKPQEQAAAPAPAPQAAAPKTAAKARPAAKPAAAEKIVCANCGEVISVKEVELEGKGSGVGAVAGGVAGGLLGRQVGQGTGKDVATVVGVVGGAVAGNKIEKVIKKTKVYDVTVKMENGEERTLRHETAPGVVAGDKVKVENEKVVKQ